MCTSVPQIEVFLIRMSTSSPPTSGTGTSSSQRPGSALLLTSACIVFCTSKKLGKLQTQESRKVNHLSFRAPRRTMVDPMQRRDRYEFASDNTAGICPEAWAALAEANKEAASSYGEDRWTRQVREQMRE